MPLSPEDQSFISALRFRMEAGNPEPPTLDEMKRAIVLLRSGRVAAATAAAASKTTRAKKSAPSAADLDDALAGLDLM